MFRIHTIFFQVALFILGARLALSVFLLFLYFLNKYFPFCLLRLWWASFCVSVCACFTLFTLRTLSYRMWGVVGVLTWMSAAIRHWACAWLCFLWRFLTWSEHKHVSTNISLARGIKVLESWFFFSASCVFGCAWLERDAGCMCCCRV